MRCDSILICFATVALGAGAALAQESPQALEADPVEAAEQSDVPAEAATESPDEPPEAAVEDTAAEADDPAPAVDAAEAAEAELDVEDDSDIEAETPEEVATEGTDWGGLIERAPELIAVTHHAAVHLPIALWLFGALFVLIGAVAPSWRTQIPLACLIGGTLGSISAAASGWWYAEHEYGDAWAWGDGLGDWSEHLVKHRWTGVALVVCSLVLSLIALINQKKKSTGLGVVWRLGLIGLALAVGWEGHIGGEMIQGEGFLEEAIQEWLNPEE